MHALIHDDLARFLANLDRLDAGGQHDAIIGAVAENYGRFDAPDGERSPYWDLDLFGIPAEGVTEEAAIDFWKRAARTKLAERDTRPAACPDLEFSVAYKCPTGKVAQAPAHIAPGNLVADLTTLARMAIPAADRDTARILAITLPLTAPAAPGA